MIKVKSFVFNPFMENTYVVYDETDEAVIIDPGCYEKQEKESLVNFISENNLRIKYLLNTHCHIDHVFGNQFIIDTYKVPLLLHEKDVETLRAVKAYAPSYGFTNYEESEPDKYIEEGETLSFGNSEFEIIFVPGHAPGHIAFIDKVDKNCFSGDVLFRESIGRTDLPGGDFDTLIDSIRTKMFALPEDMTIYSGHGETTTIEYEMKNNPFCKI